MYPGSNRTLEKSGEPSRMYIKYASLHTPYCVFFTLPTAWIHTAKERAVN